jgi:hypothetical protein
VAHRTRVRIRAVLPYVFLVELLPVRADPCWTAGPVVPDRTYQLLPSDEDWSFLRDPALREDFWDPIKYIRLRNHPDDWYLSIGGETRQDWERVGNWGEQPFQNAFYLQREYTARALFTAAFLWISTTSASHARMLPTIAVLRTNCGTHSVRDCGAHRADGRRLGL